VAALLLASAFGATSANAACADVSATYPGDSAPQGDIAAWMAGGAARAGLPGELPVMAALVESGLKNLKGGDADSVGYFQMREKYWNVPPYTGYATNPPLQLQWFVDQAVPIADGRAADSSRWGEWIADVERPAEQYRGRYQLRLKDASALIVPGCSAATGPGDGSSPDKTAPRVVLTGPLHQNAYAQRAVLVGVRCTTEACAAKAKAKITGSGLKQPASSAAHATGLAVGTRNTLRLPINAALRRAARRAIGRGHPLHARVSVTVTDMSGNHRVAVRTFTLAPKR
jgi:hypothetical protein